MTTFPIAVIQKFLKDQKCEKIGEDDTEEHYVSADDVVVIRLPKQSRIDFDLLQIIAVDQLNMSHWDFDYWLGENTINE